MGSRFLVLRCESTWPARAEHIRDARATVTALMARADVPAAVRDDVRLAVSEAMSNAVVHGYRGEDVGDVTVSAEAEDSEMKVIVSDHGCGMRPRPDSPGAGMGLPLIAEMSDSMSVTRGRDGTGTELCMTFALDRSL
jgi:serine/threonine-protein kinase RsbW/stage II sporulation protein AB (anti-sigma F factor)